MALSDVKPQAHQLMSEAWDSIEKEVKGQPSFRTGPRLRLESDIVLPLMQRPVQVVLD